MYKGENEFIFDGKKSLKLVQLTDLHFTYPGHDGPEGRTLDLIEEIARNEKPDLFVVTGDLLASPESARVLSMFCDFMDERELLWAFVFGNHDKEFGDPYPVLEEILLAAKYCIYEPGPADIAGDGNYCIKIFGENGRLHWALFMLDSGDYMTLNGRHCYACIDHSQIKWFRETRKTLGARYGGGSQALFFFHIPLPEYDTIHQMGLCRGEKSEKVCAPPCNSGLFCSMVEDSSVKGVFVGHDHGNDYEGEYHGVRLCYGRLTGHTNHKNRGAYGDDDYKRGCRVIILPAGWRDPFESYIYLEGGERIAYFPGENGAGTGI